MWTTFSTFSDNRDDDGKKNSNQLYFTFTLPYFTFLYFRPFSPNRLADEWLHDTRGIFGGFMGKGPAKKVA